MNEDFSQLSDEDLEAIASGAEPEGNYFVELAKNIPSSAGKLASDIVAPVIHPVETVKSIGQLGASLAAKVGIGNASPEMANAVGAYFADRYGGVDNVLKTLKEDPVGLMADVSTVLTGGGSLAAKAPGIVGKAGRAVSSAGAAIDPIMAAAKSAQAAAGTRAGQATIQAAKKAGSTAVAAPVGFMAMRSPDVMKEAARAGYDLNKAFLRHWSGKADIDEPVKAAKAALGELRRERADAYKSGMLPIQNDPTILDFSKIEDAVVDAIPKFEHKGKVIDPDGLRAWENIAEIVDDWSKSDPAKFHTAYDLDKLKQQLWNVSKQYDPGSRARSVADSAYHAVKKEITAQAPEYSKIMSGYEEASELIGEIEKAFLIADKKSRKAAVEPALRRLQSVMRNNVATSYGSRLQMAKKLEAQPGGKDIMPAIAGQELSSWTPRGLGAIPAAGVGLTSFLPAIEAGALSSVNPAALAYLGLVSPKVMGGVTYGAGAAGRGVTEVGKALAKKYGAAPAVPLAASAVQRAVKNPFTAQLSGGGIESLSDKELEDLLSRYPEAAGD